MKVVFEKPVLLESFVGTSKAGREYGRIRFATQDFAMDFLLILLISHRLF